ncbi:VOC family protein [Candidatus Laterigemmans baculatus]|nr:VOC family protein [Candidatus Laterigemmans baculatus]
MSAVNFSHVALNCRNMAAVEAFYTTHFGFRRARLIDLGGDGQILFLKSGSVYLELFQAAETSSVEPPQNDGPSTPGVRHLAFQVADIDAKLAEMGAAAEVTLGPLAFDDFIPGWKTVWVRDPEGMIVEISQGFVDQGDVPPMPAVATPAATASAATI